MTFVVGCPSLGARQKIAFPCPEVQKIVLPFQAVLRSVAVPLDPDERNSVICWTVLVLVEGWIPVVEDLVAAEVSLFVAAVGPSCW
jgi:hypothetical protein